MGKKGKSEQKTDWLGNKYIQHYDARGNKSGKSERKTDWLGNKYTQHYNSRGNKSGKSEGKTDWLGNKYTQKYDASGNRNGRSERKTDWLGNKYTQHYDARGNKSGKSEGKRDWFGNTYRERSFDSNKPTQGYNARDNKSGISTSKTGGIGSTYSTHSFEGTTLHAGNQLSQDKHYTLDYTSSYKDTNVHQGKGGYRAFWLLLGVLCVAGAFAIQFDKLPIHVILPHNLLSTLTSTSDQEMDWTEIHTILTEWDTVHHHADETWNTSSLASVLADSALAEQQKAIEILKAKDCRWNFEELAEPKVLKQEMISTSQVFVEVSKHWNAELYCSGKLDPGSFNAPFIVQYTLTQTTDGWRISQKGAVSVSSQTN